MIEEILNNLQSVEPQYETVLPYSKKTVLYKPFKIKDQKVLSLIAEETNAGLVLKQLCQLIKNCSSEKTPESLYLCDFEYLFLKIRSKSVEEKINLIIEKEKPIKFVLNIESIELKTGEVKTSINNGNNIILELHYPKVKDYFSIATIENNLLFPKIIKAITINKQRYDLTLINEEGIQKIVDEVYLENKEKLETFIKNGPRLSYTINDDNENILVEGFLRFFI